MINRFTHNDHHAMIIIPLNIFGESVINFNPFSGRDNSEFYLRLRVIRANCYYSRYNQAYLLRVVERIGIRTAIPEFCYLLGKI